MSGKYDYGPPPLSDEEVAHIDELFRYSHAEVETLICRCLDPRLTQEERAEARRILDRIRGE